MTNKVVLLPAAIRDLKEIGDWYRDEFSTKSAKKVTRRILDGIRLLEEFSEIGTNTPDEWLNDFEFRKLVIDEFVAIYKIAHDEILIYHIANVRRDYSRLFD